MGKTFLILGGYGNAGFLIARSLLEQSDIKVVIAGRSREKAQKASSRLRGLFKEDRIRAIQLDASDRRSMREAFSGVDMVVVASSTARYVREVAGSALDAGIDYLDLQYSTKKVRFLRTLSDRIEERGLTFITDGGFHPGLPATLIRYLGEHLDLMERAIVGTLIRVDWRAYSFSESTLREFVEEIREWSPLIYEDGRWKRAPILGRKGYVKIDFGKEWKKHYCAPMFLEEMREIPELFPSIKETGFYVAGFHWFVDFFVLPFLWVAMLIWGKRAQKPMARLLLWTLRTLSGPPFGAILKAVAKGESQGSEKEIELTLAHKDSYIFTALPVVACLLQYIDGSIKRPGLWTMANLVEPVRLLEDMRRMGIEIDLSERILESP